MRARRFGLIGIACWLAGCLGEAGDTPEGTELSSAQLEELKAAKNAASADAGGCGLCTYDAEYLNLVIGAHDAALGDVVLVAGTHSANFPYWGTEPWDNGLLLVGGEGYQFTQRTRGEALAIEIDPTQDATSAIVRYAGTMVRASDGATVPVTAELWLWATGFETRRLGKPYDVLDLPGVAGMRWRPFHLELAGGSIRIDGHDPIELGNDGSGELERGELTNFRSWRFAIGYDYVALTRPGWAYTWVDFTSHPLYREGLLGEILELHLSTSASASLTLADWDSYDGNPYGIARPDPSDASVVVLECSVDLGLANLRRQMVRSTGGDGETVYGLREIFEARPH